jgi:hypothetical protein
VPKLTAKPKKSKKVAPKRAAATARATKPSPAGKRKPAAAKPRSAPAKPKRVRVAVAVMEAELVMAAPVVGGALAMPQITSPLAGAAVPAGIDLPVRVQTNRGDFGYVLQLTDVTPVGARPAVPFPVPAPSGSPFTVVIPGVNLVAGHAYSIRVFVSPANGLTPPNMDSICPVTA